MAINIDMEKAYDRLEWSFIRDTILLYEFPEPLISLIMSYVSSSFISILFNGGALEPFLSSRGIRQGDPLTPYFFYLMYGGSRCSYLREVQCKAMDPTQSFSER